MEGRYGTEDAERNCHLSFEELRDLLKKASEDETREIGYDRDITMACVEEEFIRFEVLRAQHIFVPSLLYSEEVVRDSPFLYRKLHILRDLSDSLIKGQDISFSMSMSAMPEIILLTGL
jgi:hypothetical protein